MQISILLNRLQRDREAECKGAYDHRAQPEIESDWVFPREENRMVLKSLMEQQITQLTCGPGQASNQGHLGERQALYAKANHAPQMYPLQK